MVVNESVKLKANKEDMRFFRQIRTNLKHRLKYAKGREKENIKKALADMEKQIERRKQIAKKS